MTSSRWGRRQAIANDAQRGSPLLDSLDVALIAALHEHPRAGALQLSRLLDVARATVEARLRRLEDSRVITGYGPDIDLEAAGYPVQAIVSLEIAQGALAEVTAELAAVPEIIEAYATTGTSDVLCRIVATSHEDLQRTLIMLNKSTTVARSTSVILLSELVGPRVLPLIRSRPRATSRAPAYREAATRKPGS